MAKTISFLGEGSISWYVYDLNTKRYCELDNPSGELGEEFDDFEQMLNKMFGDAMVEISISLYFFCAQN